MEDGEEITALFSRQSGKTETVSVVVVGLSVLLPTLARMDGLKDDDRINKFKDGLWVGIFAPNYELAGIMHSRMAQRMMSETMQAVLKDPDIGIDLQGGRKVLRLPNGSYVDANSAGPQANIEGKTYHLIICLHGSTLIETLDKGQITIQQIVDSKYQGKIRALDHNTGDVVWADVLAHQRFVPYEKTYRLRFSDGTEVVSTGDHLWWVRGYGYVLTSTLFSLYNTTLLPKLDEEEDYYDGSSINRDNSRGFFPKLPYKAVEATSLRNESLNKAVCVCESSRRETLAFEAQGELPRKPRKRGVLGKIKNKLSRVLNRVLRTFIPRPKKSDNTTSCRQNRFGSTSLLMDGRWVLLGRDNGERESRLFIDTWVRSKECSFASREDRESSRVCTYNRVAPIGRVPSLSGEGTSENVRDDRSIYHSAHEIQTDTWEEIELCHLRREIHPLPNVFKQPCLLKILPQGEKESVRLISVKEEGSPEYVYDIKTTTGNFFANGILSHNCEETQDISNYKIRKSIHPMGASTNASMIKIGTPNQQKNEFFDACERNRRKSLSAGTGGLRTHFQYDYEHPARYNPRYRAYIEKEIERLGYDSDEFRMSYRLHWMLERGHFIAPEIFDACGMRETSKLRVKQKGKYIHFKRGHNCFNNDHHSENLVASIDIGRSNDSTVVTVARVWWENPQMFAGEDRYHTHLMNWLEIQGDDHETQYPQILDFLSQYNIGSLIVDATGRGDPIYDRLNADLYDKNIRVVPFIFNQRRKHEGYTILYQEIKEGRLTYPASDFAKSLRKWQRFVREMYELQKDWRGKFMDVHAPTGGKKKGTSTGHDDYADSLMLLCYLVNRQMIAVEMGSNPFLGARAVADTRNRHQGQIGAGRSRRKFDGW